MAVTRITLTYELGRSADLEAEPVPLNGRVHFAPSTRVLDTEGNVILERARITAAVVAGVMEPVSVVATDSDDISPASGLYYTVTEDVGARRSWKLAVPADSPSGELDLATVTPLSTVPPIVFPPETATDHIEDPTGAHAASAVAFDPVGSIAATDVQAALAEVASEAVAAVASEAVLRSAGDDSLSADVATKATSADLAAEITARSAADTTEATTRAAADTAEAAARSVAVAAEATARTNAIDAEATARSDADALLVPLTQKAAANGVATLDGSSKILAAQLPSVALTDTFVVGSQAAMLALSAERGDVAVRSDLSKSFILSSDSPGTLADWKELLTPADAVSSVNGRSGVVTGLAEASDVTSEAASRAAADALLLVKSANLSDLGSAGSARANLGLGTAALANSSAFDAAGAAAAAAAASQPLDTDLSAIALLTTTPFGRALLELANAAAARTALGLGTIATEAAADFIARSLVDAAGDLLVGTADNTVSRLPIGTALQSLRVNAGATALEWGAAGAGPSSDPVRLPIPGGVAPDATGTGNNPATPEKIVSSGTQTSNTPKLSYEQLLFDQSTDESWLWVFQVPSTYASGGTVRLLWGSKVTSGNVIWKAGIGAADPSSTDLDAATFVAADLSAATAVPGTVGHYKETTIALTMTGVSPSEWVCIFIGRDADHGSDTAAGDACLVGATFEYTA